jgi:hypothetical protein
MWQLTGDTGTTVVDFDPQNLPAYTVKVEDVTSEAQCAARCANDDTISATPQLSNWLFPDQMTCRAATWVYSGASGSSGACYLHRSPQLQYPTDAQLHTLAMKVMGRDDGVTPSGLYSTWQVPSSVDTLQYGFDKVLGEIRQTDEASCTAACDGNPACVGVLFQFDERSWDCLEANGQYNALRINPSGDVEGAPDVGGQQNCQGSSLQGHPTNTIPYGVPLSLVLGLDGYTHPEFQHLLSDKDTYLPTGNCKLLGGYKKPNARGFVRVMGNSIQQRLVANSNTGMCPPGYWSSTGTADCTPCPEGRTTQQPPPGPLQDRKRYRDQLMDCAVKPTWGVVSADEVSTSEALAEVRPCFIFEYSWGATIEDPDNPTPDVPCKSTGSPPRFPPTAGPPPPSRGYTEDTNHVGVVGMTHYQNEYLGNPNWITYCMRDCDRVGDACTGFFAQTTDCPDPTSTDPVWPGGGRGCMRICGFFVDQLAPGAQLVPGVGGGIYMKEGLPPPPPPPNTAD